MLGVGHSAALRKTRCGRGRSRLRELCLAVGDARTAEAVGTAPPAASLSSRSIAPFCLLFRRLNEANGRQRPQPVQPVIAFGRVLPSGRQLHSVNATRDRAVNNAQSLGR
jgi:hypothetical protein